MPGKPAPPTTGAGVCDGGGLRGFVPEGPLDGLFQAACDAELSLSA